jgi:hypothetical protein
MGLRPTQADEKRLLPEPLSHGSAHPPLLSSRPKPRDLQFRGPFVEMFRQSCHGPAAHPR